MREKKIKSTVPLYGFAAVWLIYCLFFPLYRLHHFIILICAAVLAYVVLGRIFPGETVMVEDTREVKTGDELVDNLLKEGKTAVREMRRINDSVKDAEITEKIEELIEVTDKIFETLIEDKSNYKQIRRFSEYYLPTTLKLLNAYDRMSDSEVYAEGENVKSTLERIKGVLDATVTSYKKQYDALYAHQALDIETDIIVLENMIKREGLSGKDF